MLSLLYLGYNASEEQVELARGAGHWDWVQNFAVVRASGCPIKRNVSNVMEEAESRLRLGSVEALPSSTALDVTVTNGPQLELPKEGVSLLDGASWSTAYWSVDILESTRNYNVELAAEAVDKGLLISTFSSDAAREKLYLADGGMVDTTGIVALLKRNRSRILAFYNNNDALAPSTQPQSELSSIAYLFGVLVMADTMNSLEGPRLAQVFPSALYADVIGNLSNPALLRARLSDVPVLANPYLGVAAGNLDELLIISNERSDLFINTFADPEIRARVSPDFPNRMPVGVGVFEANLLCEFKRWQVMNHAEDIFQVIGPAPGVVHI